MFLLVHLPKLMHSAHCFNYLREPGPEYSVISGHYQNSNDHTLPMEDKHMTWQQHVYNAQVALDRNDVSAAESESALALQTAAAVTNQKEHDEAITIVRRLVHLVDGITQSGAHFAASPSYPNAQEWDNNYGVACSLFQQYAYPVLENKCRKLLAWIPPCDPPTGRRQNRVMFTKMMLVDALIWQNKLDQALLLFDDKDFRNFLKWQFHPSIRRNLSYSSLYYQYLPMLPIPEWLRDNPELEAGEEENQYSYVTAGPVPGLTAHTTCTLWERIAADTTSPPLPSKSTKEKFAMALFEQGTDLEAQAYRIVVTTVAPNIDYIEADSPTEVLIADALKNISRFPRAVERLALAAEKIKHGIEVFESIVPKHPRLRYWYQALTKLNTAAGKL